MDDIIYYNANISNVIEVPTNANPSPPENTYIQSNYKADLNRNILQKSSDYYMSIIRFTIPAANIPVLIYQLADETKDISGNYVDPTTGIYSVSLSYDDGKTNTIVTKNLHFLPHYTDAPTSLSNYYYIYSYQHMLHMINNAYAEAYAELDGKTTIPAGITNRPWIVFDPATELFTFVAQEGYKNYPAPSSETVKIYMNTYLFNLFLTFGGFYSTVNENASSPTKYQVIISNNGNNFSSMGSIPPDTNTTALNSGSALPNLLNMEQQIRCLYRWNDVRSILFVGNSMGTNNEVLPTISSTINQGSYSSLPIITDFEINQNEGPEGRSTIQYNPAGQWRWINLTTDLPFNQLNFNIYWSNKYGELFPLYIAPGDSITVKFAFYKKCLLKNGSNLLYLK